MFSSHNSSPIPDRRLFRAEIRAAIAHCNALFRAGAMTKLEAERLKNGLWTILKRADFDRNYFDNSVAPDVFVFVETRLFQLVNEAATALQIGRSRPHRAAVALRLWLRDETEIISESLENLAEVLRIRLDAELFAAFAEHFRGDEMRFQEIARRNNQMPYQAVNPFDEALAEIDFVLVAHELGFDKVLENSINSVNERDFCVEFAGAAALTGLHLSNLANICLNNFESGALDRRALETVRGKSVKMFGNPMILLSLLKDAPIGTLGEIDQASEILFDSVDVLKSCLQIVTKTLPNVAAQKVP